MAPSKSQLIAALQSLIAQQWYDDGRYMKLPPEAEAANVLVTQYLSAPYQEDEADILQLKEAGFTEMDHHWYVKVGQGEEHSIHMPGGVYWGLNADNQKWQAYTGDDFLGEADTLQDVFKFFKP